MVSAIDRLAFTEDKRSGEYLFWQDSAASLLRLGLGIGIAALAGLCLGIAAGILPLLRAPLSPLLTVLSMVPPLAILPILFIVFGLGELSKVMLIVIGITPVLARDLEQRADLWHGQDIGAMLAWMRSYTPATASKWIDEKRRSTLR